MQHSDELVHLTLLRSAGSASSAPLVCVASVSAAPASLPRASLPPASLPREAAETEATQTSGAELAELPELLSFAAEDGFASVLHFRSKQHNITS